MHTLAELDPKVGDVVIYCGHIPPTEWVFEDKAGSQYLLRSCEDNFLWRIEKLPLESQWEAKHQPKEKQVTVAELNLSVGDRVKMGKKEGTVSGIGYSSVSVLWDWSDTIVGYDRCVVAPFTKLPKPEPTLADLQLKVGDGVYDTEEQSFGVVDLSNELFVGVVYCGRRASLIKTIQASRLKKLEVPK